jgi:cyclase
MRVLQPHPHIFAYYDGRVPGYRFSPEDNWVDDGALELGIASYSIVDGDEALVYDTHVSVVHAQFIRDHLEGLGVVKITVLLSHWHLDHVAGTEVFADCVIIANQKTADHLAQRKSAIEAALESGLPAIYPLILPSQVFSGECLFQLGQITMKFLEFNIHSDDASVIWLEEQGILLAGDTVEDTITYVAEPDALRIHLHDLARLKALNPQFILPNHGQADVTAAGGYGVGLIDATEAYVNWLIDFKGDSPPTLSTLAEPWIAQAWCNYFEPYERVHQKNIRAVQSRNVQAVVNHG